MLRNTPCQKYRTLHVDEIMVDFSLAYKGTKVRPHTFDTLFKLTRAAGGLWLLHRLWELLVQRKHLC